MCTSTIILIIYILGVTVTFKHLLKNMNLYKANHPNEIHSKDEDKYMENMIIITSLFSWLAFITLVAGSFCHTNEK